MRKNKNMQIAVFTMLAISVLLTGCGDGKKTDAPEVKIDEYEKVVYDTFSAVKGDITPTLTIKLSATNYDKKSYYPLYDDMEIESVNVSVGDKVKNGDVLISFKSGDIAGQIEGYENQIEQNNLLIEHYTNLSQIDTSVDYSKDLENLNESNQVAGLYIQELKAKLDSYSIKAEGDGSIYILSDILEFGDGKVGTSNNLVTVVYGSGQYKADVSDDYDFKVGDTYTATYGIADYELVLADITEEESGGFTVKHLTFNAASDETDFSNRDKLNLTVEKETLKNVLYVPEECVFEVDDKSYVYLLDDDGFREAVCVTVGSTVDGYTVIESGIAEGDRVVIN